MRRPGELEAAFEPLRAWGLPLATVSAWADGAIATATCPMVHVPVEVVEHIATLHRTFDEAFTAAVDSVLSAREQGGAA